MFLNTKKTSIRKENLIKSIDDLPDKVKNLIYERLANSTNPVDLEQKAQDKGKTVTEFEFVHYLYMLLLTKLEESLEEKRNRALTEEESFNLNVFIAEQFISDISRAFDLLDDKEKIILECFRRGMKLKELQQFRRFQGRSLEQLSKDFFRAKANFIDYFGMVSHLEFNDDLNLGEIISIVVSGFAEDEFPADPVLLKLLNFVVRPAEDDKNRTKIREKIKVFLAYTYIDSAFSDDDAEVGYDEVLMAIDYAIKGRKIKCKLPEISNSDDDHKRDPEEEKKQRDIILEPAILLIKKQKFKGEIKERFSNKFSRICDEVVYKFQKILVKTFGTKRLKEELRIKQGEKLIVASFIGDLRKVKELIDDGADVNFLGKNWNPLHAAIRSEEIEILKYLIGRGADLNFFCKGYSPLHFAIEVEARHLRFGEVFDEGSNEENKDFPQPVLTEILVKAGANINSDSHKWGTPLELAKKMEHKFAVELLQLRGNS
ncbi:MAG: ankyrin repeat domain-containing protein [Blastocatellia bacterium]